MAEQRLVMRDIMDGELVTSDGRHIGRVDDIAAEWREDGRLRLVELLTGPQALAGRVASRLRPISARLLRNRFEHAIPIDEALEFGPDVKLRQPASAYDTGRSDEWIASRILRFIPGSGRR
jgi:hypothetical protein